MASVGDALSLESVGDAFRAIRAHKLRSLLTLTGIIFGVSSVVSMFSIVAGIRAMVMSDFAHQGEQQMFSFQRKDVKSDRARDHASRGMVFRDAGAAGAAPAVLISSAAIYSEKIVQGILEPASVPVIGIEPGYLDQRPMVLTGGRSITSLDVEERHRVAVVGKGAAELLFGKQDPIGREFRIGNGRFTVVGTVRAVRFRLVPEDPKERERRIFIPVTTLMAWENPNQAITSVEVKSRSVADVGLALRDSEARLLQRHRGVKDYEIQNDAAEIGKIVSLVGKMMTGWNIVLGAIAILSLLIGGIGLFSILQIAVRERVREIGIKKAVGADDADIRREFLAESLTLATTGGIAGILLGSGILLIAERVALHFGKHWVIPISLPGAALGLGFAILVGFVFGLYPASKAAGLNPIEAIRD